METLANDLYRHPLDSEEELLIRLESVMGSWGVVYDTDTRIIAFIEFCFFKAEGPYSPSFDKYLLVLKNVLSLHQPMRHLLNVSATHAIGNMVLNARGKLKFKICDNYELIKVLKAWPFLGLTPTSQEAVLSAILQKNSVKQRLKRKDLYLLACLAQIFPKQKNRFVSPELDLKNAIFESHHSRFERLVNDLESQGITFSEMIKQENQRSMPPGIYRNNFLSYLLKRKHDFTCQICSFFPSSPSHFPQPIEVHHIIPLSQGGDNYSSNLICLCSHHHQEVHLNRISITLMGSPPKIIISDGTSSHKLSSN